MTDFAIRPAGTEADLAEAARFMMAYKSWLELDVFDNPIQRADEVLPGPYAAPDAGILLARPAGEPDGPEVGVAACKAIMLADGSASSEMKRLLLADEPQWQAQSRHRAGTGQAAQGKHKGRGLARLLSLAVMDAAGAACQSRMVRDTLPSLTTALRLYRDLGFTPVPRYNDNSVAGVVF